MATKTNSQKINGLIKDLKNTPHEIGLALFSTVICDVAKSFLENESYKEHGNPIISETQYKDLYERIVQHLD